MIRGDGVGAGGLRRRGADGGAGTAVRGDDGRRAGHGGGGCGSGGHAEGPLGIGKVKDHGGWLGSAVWWHW